ncbi:MAG: thiamine-phosphate kinase [Rubricoccaceae bacterium]
MPASSPGDGPSAPEPFTPIADVGEFGLIDRLADVLDARSGPPPETLVEGIGDDAAVYRVGDGPDGRPRVHVVTTDALVEGVHFDRTFTPLRYLGWKAIAVNVSDVAAMNAAPRYATVALGLPSNVSAEQTEALYAGMADACARYGLALVGGDTTASPRLVLSVTVIGEAAEDEVVYRRGAQPGELLCVTGDLGAAAAGLQVLLSGKTAALGTERDGARREPPPGDGADGRAGPGAAGHGAAAPIDLSDYAYVVERQLYPQARLDRVRAWREAGVRPTALIDVSDGLASEVHHLCTASAVGAVVEAGLLPLHVQTMRAAERFGAAPEAYALYGGEDYELLFTLPETDAARLDPATFAVVGQIVEPEAGVLLRSPEGDTQVLRARGFRHF